MDIFDSKFHCSRQQRITFCRIILLIQFSYTVLYMNSDPNQYIHKLFHVCKNINNWLMNKSVVWRQKIGVNGRQGIWWFMTWNDMERIHFHLLFSPSMCNTPEIRNIDCILQVRLKDACVSMLLRAVMGPDYRSKIHNGHPRRIWPLWPGHCTWARWAEWVRWWWQTPPTIQWPSEKCEMAGEGSSISGNKAGLPTIAISRAMRPHL